MKKILTLLFGVFFLSNLFGQVIITPVADETEFFSVPESDRAFHVLMRAAGTDTGERELLIGNGDFVIPPIYTPGLEADYIWSFDQTENFSLEFDSGINELEFRIGNVLLVEEPTGPFNTLHIANINYEPYPFLEFQLTNLSLSLGGGQALPNLITTGDYDNPEFKGMFIHNLDFSQDWVLTGSLTFLDNSNLSTGFEFVHGTNISIYGSNIEDNIYIPGTPIPEPSTIGIISVFFVLTAVTLKRKFFSKK